MGTIFSSIINGTIPSYKVAENERFYAFLDIHPLAIGHVLVVPKEEIDYIFDIPDELLKEFIVFAKSVARAIENVVPCQRIGIAVIGLEVAHAHIHLVPLQTIYDIDFKKPKLALSESEMTTIARNIAESFQKIRKQDQ